MFPFSVTQAAVEEASPRNELPPKKKLRLTTTMPLTHTRTTVAATYSIPVADLPTEWRTWEKETMRLRPTASTSCPTPPEAIHTTFVDADDVLHVPRFWGLQHWGPPARDTRCRSATPLVMNFQATLNAVQVEATTAALRELQDGVGGALLVLPCGFGKTVCALYIASRLQQKTMVVVHSEALADQWGERISTFLPGATIGRLQKDTELDGNIVICMIQSLLKRPYTGLDTYGLVIIDEAHHVAAPMFAKALAKLPARHVLGLSATPDRGDGLGYALEWYLGPTAFRTTREAVERVDVHVWTYTQGAEREVLNRKGDPMCSTMVTNLAADGRRTVWLKELVCAQAEVGRNILVLGDRLDMLRVLYKMLAEDLPHVSVAQVVGGTAKKERDRVFADARIILSTYSFASEGLDIPRLDTLLLATPRSNIEQSVGRILRPCASKQRPLIIDVRDPFSLFVAMAFKRQRFYKSQNYTLFHSDDE